MTLRTKSKSQQWTVWLCVAIVLVVAYVVLSWCLYGIIGWNIFEPRFHRLALPLIALFVYVAKETRWDGIVREAVNATEGTKGTKATEVTQMVASASATADTEVGPPTDATRAEGDSPTQPKAERVPPAELYVQARGMKHRPIPDFEHDGEYLRLLGQAAALGYAPASVKLGEYAMRRRAWVEAYYWMSQARQNGMNGLAPILCSIRQRWAIDRYPEQKSNVNALFTQEAGDIGRALLHVDTGRKAVESRAFLKAHHPEFFRA